MIRITQARMQDTFAEEEDSQNVPSYFKTYSLAQDGSVWKIWGSWTKFASKLLNNFEFQTKQIVPTSYEYWCDLTSCMLLDFEGNVWKQNMKDLNSLPEQIFLPVAVTKIEFVAYEYRGFFLDAESNVWAIGDNSQFESEPKSQEELKQPYKIESLNNIIDIACGFRFSYFITIEGDVFLAKNNRITKVSISNVKKIAVQGHSLFLTNSGAVYGAGDTRDGKIGHVSRFGRFFAPDFIDLDKPVKILYLPKIMDIGCRVPGSFCLTEEGTVLMLGYKPRIPIPVYRPYVVSWGDNNIQSMYRYNDIFYFKTKNEKLFINSKHPWSGTKELPFYELPAEFGEKVHQPVTIRLKSGRK